MSHSPLLDVHGLAVDAGGTRVLRAVSLSAAPGTLTVLMGANGSGKSTLALALAGHPRCTVTAGRATLAGRDLLALAPQERARAGLFLSFQAPPDIPGVKTALFARTALNQVLRARGAEELDAFDFLAQARCAAGELGLPESLLNRPLNDGFSGGERKRTELLQMALLQPALCLLDEIDSGMDIDGVRATVALLQRLRAQGTAFIVISHTLSMIEALVPDAVLRLDDGRIAEHGGLALARDIARRGYARASAPAPVAGLAA